MTLIHTISNFILKCRIMITNMKNQEKKINIRIDERKFNDENHVLRITNKIENLYSNKYMSHPVVIYKKGKVRIVSIII